MWESGRYEMRERQYYSMSLFLYLYSFISVLFLYIYARKGIESVINMVSISVPYIRDMNCVKCIDFGSDNTIPCLYSFIFISLSLFFFYIYLRAERYRICDIYIPSPFCIFTFPNTNYTHILLYFIFCSVH
jgi:hypothetical protein